MVQAPTPPQDALLALDGFRLARDLCGVTAAHRVAYEALRAELLATATAALEDALGQALVSRRPPPSDGDRR